MKFSQNVMPPISFIIISFSYINNGYIFIAFKHTTSFLCSYNVIWQMYQYISTSLELGVYKLLQKVYSDDNCKYCHMIEWL